MGAPDKSQGNSSSMQRVKVYRLGDDGKWDDQGTGHVTVDYLERSEEPGLFVLDEEDNETLLLHRISPDDIYRKQEDTIISWRDPEFSTELALSFQESSGCSYIWDYICNMQRNLHFSTLNNETFQTMTSELRDLPPIELSTLPLLLKTMMESGLADQIRLAELILQDQDKIPKLMDLFKICEDLENIDSLHMIFKIVKGIILLNNTQIFEKIFGDDLIMDIIGSLEYDPDVPQVQHYRKYLKEHVVFKEAIPIKNPVVLSKIHQTYRVGYLKDVVLARFMDEAIAGKLNSMIQANNALVASLLKDDSTFIQELFVRLKTPSISPESKKNLVLFLYEFCSLSKSLQMVQQLQLFRDLMTEGVFDIITDTLQSQDKKLVLTGTDILMLFLNQDPSLLRSYVVRQEGIELLGLLVKGLITDFGADMHCQFLEILRILLDSYALSGPQVPIKDTIVDIFYEKHLGQLIDVIVASCPSDGIVQSTDKSGGNEGRLESHKRTKPEILSNICEILCFCVTHHPYRIKCSFLLGNVIDKVLLLTRRREKYLVCAAVRFVRTLLVRHDEHLMNHFVKNNLLKPIIDAFIANGDRYNLLNSSILDLLEHIRKENLRPLLIYVIDSFWSELVKFEHLASIQALKVKYEQLLEKSGAKTNADAVDPRSKVDERGLDKEEEDYFNEDSEEEDTTSPSRSQKVQSQPVLSNGVAPSPTSSSPRSGGLVDYEDDEDDEDYKPPPKKQPESLEEDEGAMESLRLKRKLASKNKESELAKKPRLGKNIKAKDSVFAALCSTLSQAVLPSKKSINNVNPSSQPETTQGNKGQAEENLSHPVEENHQEREPGSSGSGSDSTISDDKNHDEVESGSSRNGSDKASSDEENHSEDDALSSRNHSDHLHNSSDNRQLVVEDGPLIPPNSSPEMAVNGS